MNTDDEMVTLLRSSARVLPGTQAEHVAAAAAAGRRIRRRRRAAAVVGAGTAGLVVVVGVAAFGVNAGNDTATVVQPATPAVDNPQTPEPPTSERAAAEARGRANDQLLLDALGPDFGIDSSEGFDQVVLREGSAAAAALPKGWTADVGLMLLDDLRLSALCKPFQEKGLVHEACSSVTLPGDRTVYVQKAVLENPKFAPGRGTNFYFGRSDGSIIRITFTARGPMGAGEAAQARAADWLTGYQDALAGVAADERIQPRPTASGRTHEVPSVTSHDRDLVILQRALGMEFNLSDGKLALESNWPLYKALPSLPHGNWTVVGDITSIDRSAFDAACAAKPGAAACEKRTIDGNEVHVRTWADQDAKNEFVGESAAYLIRPDGRVVLAILELTSDQLEPARGATKVAAVEDWLRALQPSLIKAVTDPKVKG